MQTLGGKWKRRIRSDADADADTDTDTNQNSFFSPLQCRTEAKHGYSFAKVAHSLSMPEMTPEYKSRLLFLVSVPDYSCANSLVPRLFSFLESAEVKGHVHI